MLVRRHSSLVHWIAGINYFENISVFFLLCPPVWIDDSHILIYRQCNSWKINLPAVYSIWFATLIFTFNETDLIKTHRLLTVWTCDTDLQGMQWSRVTCKNRGLQRQGDQLTVAKHKSDWCRLQFAPVVVTKISALLENTVRSPSHWFISPHFYFPVALTIRIRLSCLILIFLRTLRLQVPSNIVV